MQPKDLQAPKGTLLILLLYAGLTVLLWGSMYLTMILRR